MSYKSVLSHITSSIRYFDIYGKSITFTYEGEERYKTSSGGIVTISILIGLIFYASHLLDLMVNYK